MIGDTCKYESWKILVAHPRSNPKAKTVCAAHPRSAAESNPNGGTVLQLPQKYKKIITGAQVPWPRRLHCLRSRKTVAMAIELPYKLQYNTEVL